MDSRTYSVSGMACNDCEDALETMDGVSRVGADHETGTIEAVAVEATAVEAVADEAIESAASSSSESHASALPDRNAVPVAQTTLSRTTVPASAGTPTRPATAIAASCRPRGSHGGRVGRRGSPSEPGRPASPPVRGHDCADGVEAEPTLLGEEHHCDGEVEPVDVLTRQA
jgi:copper chaperone CopZ